MFFPTLPSVVIGEEILSGTVLCLLSLFVLCDQIRLSIVLMLAP